MGTLQHLQHATVGIESALETVVDDELEVEAWFAATRAGCVNWLTPHPNNRHFSKVVGQTGWLKDHWDFEVLHRRHSSALVPVNANAPVYTDGWMDFAGSARGLRANRKTRKGYADNANVNQPFWMMSVLEIEQLTPAEPQTVLMFDQNDASYGDGWVLAPDTGDADAYDTLEFRCLNNSNASVVVGSYAIEDVINPHIHYVNFNDQSQTVTAKLDHLQKWSVSMGTNRWEGGRQLTGARGGSGLVENFKGRMGRTIIGVGNISAGDELLLHQFLSAKYTITLLTP